jgi:hypothetical protein
MKKNGKLDGAIAYLAGPIESVSDNGVIWRKEFIDKKNKYNLPIRVIDPTNKHSKDFEEIGNWRTHLRKLKKDGNFDEVTNEVKKIRRWDLRAIDYASLVVVKINKSIPTWGTIDEIVVAERQQKPVLAIVDGGAKNCPDWLFAIIRHKEMFSSVSECINYLKDINDGKILMDNRWIFINGY